MKWGDLKFRLLPAELRILLILLSSSAVSVALLTMRVIAGDSTRYWFLNWNLFLAWLPLLFSWWLLRRLPKSRWLSWQNLLLSALWLGFLPNAFYIVSDLVHLRPTGEVSLLTDVVVMISFTWNGFLLGYLSLFTIHAALLKRIKRSTAHIMVAIILVLCSFAIYLGRYLRWNSWDILVNPLGLIVDVTDPFVNPSVHPQAFTTTCLFFILLGSIYAVAYQVVLMLKTPYTND